MGKIYVFEELLVLVHDDLSPWAAMDVKLDDKRRLVVEMTYEDYDDGYNPYYGYDRRIIVTPKGTEALIKRLNTTLTKLTKAFRREFAGNHMAESRNVREVFDIFNEIRNYLECLNIHYRIENEYKYR